MTTSPHNPPPPSITEHDLLALVEGVSIAGDRAAAAREAMARDPRLAELVAQMRDDREGLASLGEVAAPSDLLDRVEVQLERDALVGLAKQESTPSGVLPISSYVAPKQRGTSVMTKPWAMPLATAAGILLVAGGVLMLYQANRASPVAPLPAPPEHTLAHRDVPIVKPVEPVAVKPEPKPEVVAVKTDPAPVEPTPAPVVAGVTIEQALAAARDGRLMIRLVTKEPDKAEARVETLAKSDALRGTLDPLADSVGNRVTVAYLAALSAEREAVAVRPRPNEKPVETPAIAGTNHEKPVAAVTHPVPPPPPAPEPVVVLGKRSWLARVPLDASRLDALRKALGNDAIEAEFHVLPRRVAVDTPLDEPSILWWTGTPSDWQPRVGVPIVVQGK